jgi:hypothetical protein
VFKPEYAGKTLKCKCGQPIKAPAAVPAGAPAAARQPGVAKQPAAAAKQSAALAAAPPTAQPAAVSSGGDEFSNLFAEAEAEYAVAPEPPPSPKSKPPIARPAAAAAGGGPVSPMLAYARTVSKPPPDDATKAAMVSDLYIPIALVIVGLVAYMFDAHLRGAHNAVEASIFVFVSCFLNLLLVFGALLAGVKLIGIGLGPLGPALLKVTAVAILPAAVGELIQWYSGIGFVAWGITLVMYYVMLYYLFDMDGGEIRIVTGIMWAVQFLLGMFILGALMSGVGFSAGSGSGSFKPRASVSKSMFSGAQEADDVPDDAQMSPGELDKWCEVEINKKAAFEAHEWLDPKFTSHQGLGWSKSEVRELTDKFVVGGARKIWCAAIENGEQGDVLCTRLIVEMPDDPAKRGRCLDIRDFAEKREEPSKDGNGKFITVMIHIIKPHRN